MGLCFCKQTRKGEVGATGDAIYCPTSSTVAIVLHKYLGVVQWGRNDYHRNGVCAVGGVGCWQTKAHMEKNPQTFWIRQFPNRIWTSSHFNFLPILVPVKHRWKQDKRPRVQFAVVIDRSYASLVHIGATELPHQAHLHLEQHT